MTDMQTSLPLLIVRPSMLNSVCTSLHNLWPVKWNALQVIPLPCAFLFIFPNIDATQAPNSIKSFDHHHESTLGLIFLEWYDLLHIITWPLWSIDLDHARSSPWPRSIGTKSCSSFTATRSLASKPWLALHHCNRSIKPSLVLILSTLVTWLHVMSHMQWVPPSHYMSIVSTLSHFSSMAHVAHTSVFVWTNHLCIST